MNALEGRVTPRVNKPSKRKVEGATKAESPAPKVAKVDTLAPPENASKAATTFVGCGLRMDKHSVFELYCGDGADVAYFQSKGIKTGGWDPITNPKARITKAHWYFVKALNDKFATPKEIEELVKGAWKACSVGLVLAINPKKMSEEQFLQIVLPKLRAPKIEFQVRIGPGIWVFRK